MALEDEVLDALVAEGRRSVADLARLTGRQESEVAAAVADLEEAGIVRGYTAVVDWERTDRERVRATVEVDVTLDRETGYDDVAERLVEFPEVAGLRLVSGDYDFDLQVEAGSMHEVSRFVSDQVARMPEITRTVTHYVMETYKERGVELNDGHDDDRLSVSP